MENNKSRTTMNSLFSFIFQLPRFNILKVQIFDQNFSNYVFQQRIIVI